MNEILHPFKWKSSLDCLNVHYEDQNISLSCIIFLPQIRRDEKVGKLSGDVATQQSVEILTALKKLGESLTPEEESYLQSNSSASLKQFEQVSGDLGRTLRIQFHMCGGFFSAQCKSYCSLISKCDVSVSGYFFQNMDTYKMLLILLLQKNTVILSVTFLWDRKINSINTMRWINLINKQFHISFMLWLSRYWIILNWFTCVPVIFFYYAASGDKVLAVASSQVKQASK